MIKTMAKHYDELHKFSDKEKDRIIRGLLIALWNAPTPMGNIDGSHNYKATADRYRKWRDKYRSMSLETAGKTWNSVITALDGLHLLKRMAEKHLPPFDDYHPDTHKLEIVVKRYDNDKEVARHDAEWLIAAADTLVEEKDALPAGDVDVSKLHPMVRKVFGNLKALPFKEPTEDMDGWYIWRNSKDWPEDDYEVKLLCEGTMIDRDPEEDVKPYGQFFGPILLR